MGLKLVKWKREEREREEREEDTTIRAACETSELNIILGDASDGLDTAQAIPLFCGSLKVPLGHAKSLATYV